MFYVTDQHPKDMIGVLPEMPAFQANFDHGLGALISYLQFNTAK